MTSDPRSNDTTFPILTAALYPKSILHNNRELVIIKYQCTKTCCRGMEGKAGDCEQRTPPLRDKFVQEEKIKILQNEVNIVCIVYDLP